MFYVNPSEEIQNDEILIEKYNKLNSKVDPDSSISDNDVSISENDNITKTVSDILNNSQDSEFYNKQNRLVELGKIFEVEKVNFQKANESSKSSNSKKSSSNLNRSQNGYSGTEQTSKENLSDSTRETDSGKIDNLE
jgi:hypothetical protein